MLHTFDKKLVPQIVAILEEASRIACDFPDDTKMLQALDDEGPLNLVSRIGYLVIHLQLDQRQGDYVVIVNSIELRTLASAVAIVEWANVTNMVSTSNIRRMLKDQGITNT